MPRPRAVLFDFGGVLTSSPFDAFARYEEESGLPPGFLRELNARNPHENAWARLERSEATFDEFCVAFEAEAAQMGQRLDARAVMALLSGELRPVMVEAVRRCREQFKTGLLTNNWRSAPGADFGVDAALGLFDVVIESAVVGFRKPDPRIYELACERLDVRPEEVVFLDDLGVNLKPARALGMTTIKVVDADTALAELEDACGLDLRGDLG